MEEHLVESSARLVLDLSEKIRVLHVDDDSGLLNFTKQCLEMEGPLQVDTAVSVDEALMKLKNDKYDIVVSDYQMPEKDGLDFLKTLRSKGNTIPFIMFTGKGREEVAIKALNLGANQYLNKTGETETVYTELAHSIMELAKIKRAEEKLRESEAIWLEREKKLEAIFASSADALTVFDLKGNVVELNEAAMRLHGFSEKKEILGKSSFQYVAPRDNSKAFELLENTLREGSVRKVEVSLLTVDGREFPAELSANVVKDASGIPICIMVTTRDLSERKKTEEALRESETKYRELVDFLPEMVFEIDTRAHLIFANKRAFELTGYSKEDLNQGFNVNGLVAPEDMERSKENMKKMFVGEMRHSNEYIFVRRDGTHFPVSLSSAPIIREGKIIGARGIVIDITKQKKVEEVLKQSEGKYRELFENAYDVILALDLNGRVIEANNAVARYGFRKEDVIGNSILDLVPGKDRPVLMKDFSQAAQGKSAKNEIEIQTPNGTITAEYCASVLLREGNVAGVQVIIRGLDERKQYEKTVKESQQRFRGLFMGNPEAATYVGPDYCVLEINPRFEELFGYSLEEIKGKNINEVVVPKDKMDEAEALNKKAVGGYVYHNTKRRRKDGSLVPVAVSAAPISVEGEPAGFVAMYKDISDLKNAEKRLESMNEKLQVVGGLTRHDVRNKLGTVAGNAFLLKKKYAEHMDIVNGLKEMEQACTEIVRIFDFAKTYEMLGVEDLNYIDVEKTFNEAVSLFSGLTNLKVANNCHGLTVLADSMLRQLVYNLIDNSLKHGQKVTTMKIRYEKTEQDKLEVFYEDDGVGVPAENKSHLFKEGYSTGGSTGYGLYLIKKMTEVYGWTIQEKGEPGKGALFTITIPKTNQNGKENYHVV